MAARTQMAALLAVVALVAAACGATAVDSDTTSQDIETPSETTEVDPTTIAELDEREGGFGPGSLVVNAGEVLTRLVGLEGPWDSVQPYAYEVLPAVCGVTEPVAVQGVALSLLDPTEQLFPDSVFAEVSVYRSEPEASAVVQTLNGPTAADCDRAGLAQFDEDVPEIGLQFDLGDGIGNPTESPATLPDTFEAESRRYEGSLSAGSISRDLVQVESRAAHGRYSIHLQTFTAATDARARADELHALAYELLLSDPLPEVIVDESLDAAVDAVRGSLFAPPSEIPEFYDLASSAVFSPVSVDSDSCYQSPAADAMLLGPTWVAESPGVGASRLTQVSLIHSDAEAGAASFSEFVDLGVDCFVESLNLPPEFEVKSRSFETVVIDDIEVVTAHVELAQTIGGQIFDVEAGIAVAASGRFTNEVFFFGLIGDSPELGELAALTAQRLEQS